MDRSGFKDTPQVLLNGVPIDSKSLTAEDFEEAIMMGLMRETNALQKAVYKNSLNDQVKIILHLGERLLFIIYSSLKRNAWFKIAEARIK